jgi:hypothetical protein
VLGGPHALRLLAQRAHARREDVLLAVVLGGAELALGLIIIMIS